MKLKQVESREETDHARVLLEEYAAALNIDLCFQGFEKELRELPLGYSPPDGGLLLASIEGDSSVGIVWK